jgi:hypothetical protein
MLLSCLSCSSDDIEPQDIVQLAYTQSGTIAGISHELVLSDEQQRFKTRQCEKRISYADWRTLLIGFDWQAFEQLPEKKAAECCDQAEYALVISTRNKTYRRVWSSFTPNVPESIVQINDSLSQRSWTESQTCR